MEEEEEEVSPDVDNNINEHDGIANQTEETNSPPTTRKRTKRRRKKKPVLFLTTENHQPHLPTLLPQKGGIEDIP